MSRMLYLAAVIVALGAVAYSSVAWAACPPGTTYSCYQGMNGKVICGCR